MLASLVAAFAAPVLMVSSADMFIVAGGDEIAARLVAESGDGSDLVIAANGALGVDAVDGLVAALDDRLDRIERVGDPEPTIFTESLGLGEPAVDPSVPVAVRPGSGAKFFVRDGAIEALDVIDARPGVDGIWISERYAERFDLEPGAVVGIEGASTSVTIAGVHRDIWADGRDDYWDEVAGPLVPRFSRIFGAPLFELFITSADVVDDLELVGTVRLDVAIVDPPTTERGLAGLVESVRAVERDFTGSSTLSGALDGFSGIGAAVPTLSTDLFDVEEDVATRSAELDQPITTTSVAGVVLGLLISVAGGGFIARRRRRELRLLRADGDSRWRFAARSLAEYAPLGVVGAMAGIGAAWLVIRVAGPTRRAALGDVDLSTAFACAAGGVACASIATAVIAGRSLDRPVTGSDAALLRWLLPVGALAVAAWVQVGGERDRESVDLMVVMFPIVGLVGGVGLVVAMLRGLLTKLRRSGGTAPTTLFLAWRRVAAAPIGAVGLAIVVGSAFGLVVFPTLLISSLDDASQAKARAAVGGATSVRLIDPLVELPAGSTVIATQTTRLSVEARRVSAIAVDPATFGDAVMWDPYFGSSVAGVLATLEAAESEVPADAIPVMLVGERSVPVDAAFGTTSIFDYRVVGSLDAAPLVSIEPTILFSAGRFEDVAFARHVSRRPSDVSEDSWAEEYRSPLLDSRAHLVTDIPLRELRTILDQQEVRYRNERTLQTELDTLDNQSVRWSFAYFRILAAIAAIAAAAGLLLHLEEQRVRRELADAVTRRMGLSSGGRLRASLLETGGLVTVALAAGTVVSIALAKRIFDRFEPGPTALPDTDLQIAWSTLVGVILTGQLITGAIVTAVHVRGHRRPLGEILRGN